jgi:hypothetical protein
LSSDDGSDSDMGFTELCGIRKKMTEVGKMLWLWLGLKRWKRKEELGTNFAVLWTKSKNIESFWNYFLVAGVYTLSYHS